MDFTEHDFFVKKEEHLSARIDTIEVLMSMHDGKYYSLNGVASRIWELLIKPLSLSELCSILQGEYAISKEICENEVRTYLAQLLKMQLIEHKKKVI